MTETNANNTAMSARDFKFKRVRIADDPITGQKRYQDVVIAPDGTMQKTATSKSRSAAQDNRNIGMYQKLASVNDQNYNIRTQNGGSRTTIRPDGSYQVTTGNEDGSTFGQTFDKDHSSASKRTLGYLDSEGDFVSGRATQGSNASQGLNASLNPNLSLSGSSSFSTSTQQEPANQATADQATAPRTESLMETIRGLTLQLERLRAQRAAQQRMSIDSSRLQDPAYLYDAWRRSRRMGYD